MGEGGAEDAADAGHRLAQAQLAQMRHPHHRERPPADAVVVGHRELVVPQGEAGDGAVPGLAAREAEHPAWLAALRLGLGMLLVGAGEGGAQVDDRPSGA